ncbi:MAG: folylpolyglutamate synthase/dihydrofolate synthase family protein [Bacteroidota bacterium]
MYQRVGDAAYKKDLHNTLALLDVIGNPHTRLQCIHVAGTNGKGSVSHMIASALQEAGFTCGLYISPHYKDYRERIKINGNYITEEYVISFVEKIKPAIEEIQPSFFELTVAMAFDYFAFMQVDYAVIETGLGGRLDSTNVIEPLLSVITNISYDHMHMLGNTLPEIAGEKAGIIKKNTPVVIGETQAEVKEVFLLKAIEKNSTIYFADKEVQILDYKKTDIATAQFDIQFNDSKIEHIEIDYATRYQKKNIITAAYSLKILQQFGINISDEQIKLGLSHLRKNTAFIGRWNIVQKEPVILLDSAHNEAGIRELVTQLQEIKYQTLHWVYGTVSDKDVNKVLALLPIEHTHYYLCKPNIPRGMETGILAEYFIKHTTNASTYTSVQEAFDAAKKQAKKEDIIVVSGSIFIVAEII